MQAIVLAYLEGLTHRELADRMEIPLGTAKSSVRRGLQGLRRCMEGQASSDDLAPLLAGEYSLGVLRGQARDRFMRKRSQQAHICHLADEWDYRLAALIDLLPETPPAPEVWHEIEKALPSYTSKRTDKHVWRPVALGLLALCVVLIALLAIP
jgi:anti-sigma-K factor RskA